jgi:hypothetical protein
MACDQGTRLIDLVAAISELRIPRCCAQHGRIFSNSRNGPWGNKEFIFPTGNLMVAASPATLSQRVHPVA